jgi:hypothetical protein
MRYFAQALLNIHRGILPPLDLQAASPQMQQYFLRISAIHAMPYCDTATTKND